jgi:transposase
VVAIVQRLIGRIGQAAAQQASAPSAAAMDATGLAASTASEYFRSRTGNRCSQWVKVSVVVLCTSLLAVGLIVSLGPSNDRTQAEALLTQVQAISRPDKLYADGGYDAEWIHARCREDWGVESFIKPLNHRADGTRSGHWRRGMSPEHLRAQGYGRRWAVESFFSGLKRTMGASLNARRTDQMLAEASFRVLAYALRVRQACRMSDVFNKAKPNSARQNPRGRNGCLYCKSCSPAWRD